MNIHEIETISGRHTKIQSLIFSGKKNDLLLLDNIFFTHGRETYEGPHKVLVGNGQKL